MQRYDKWQLENISKLECSFIECRSDEFEEFCQETYDEAKEEEKKNKSTK